MSSPIPVMATRWKEAWESLDPDRIAALYAPDAKHKSSVVARLAPEAKENTLNGREEIRAYAKKVAGNISSFRADIIGVVTEGNKAAVEYWRVRNGEEAQRARVLELIEWEGDYLTDVRVYHE